MADSESSEAAGVSALWRGRRVLFVGDLNPWSKGVIRGDAFRALGFEVEALSHTARGDPETGGGRPSLAFRIGWKLGVQIDTEGVNRRIIDAARARPADLIWIEKGNMIRPATLRALRALCPDARLASYSDDDMTARHNRTRAYARGLRSYDVVFTTKSYNAAPGELPALGARRVVVLDKAFDPAQHRPVPVDASARAAYGADVGFIGSFERPRAEAMARLARDGIAVRVWGNGWEAFRDGHDNLTLERRPLINSQRELRYSTGIAATRINLAFLRKANRDLQTDRSIEIPACGGFMLAEYSDEHARLFEEGREAAFFRSTGELAEKIRYYLAHEDERAQIAAAGRARCLASGYSHLDRVRFMVGQALGRSCSIKP